jgi:hypothetical protein
VTSIASAALTRGAACSERQDNQKWQVKPRFTHFAFVLFFVLNSASSSDDNGPTDGLELPDWIDSVYLHGGYGMHWKDSDDYQGDPWLGGLELAQDEGHRVGISLFNNSFGQFCQYFYYGYQWRLPFISSSAHLKLTGGVIHGYVDEFEDKLDVNFNGWAPAIVPSVGWKNDRWGFDAALLGNSGVMFLIGYDIWRR